MSAGGESVRDGTIGQMHDRTVAAVYDSENVLEEVEMEPDVSISSKMMSAVSGSILTSLLGMLLYFALTVTTPS